MKLPILIRDKKIAPILNGSNSSLIKLKPPAVMSDFIAEFAENFIVKEFGRFANYSTGNKENFSSCHAVAPSSNKLPNVLYFH